MDEKIISSIKVILGKLNSPITKKPLILGQDCNVVVKNGNANITIEIDPKNAALYEEFQKSLQKMISGISGVISSNVVLTSNQTQAYKTSNENKYRTGAKNIIAIASGKGGVGKSTVAVNLAIALKNIGYSVALLDADIYGPSIPRMMGISEKPTTNSNNKLIPLENYGVTCMSIGFLITPETPAIWRGPMVMKALEQLFINVEWKNPDYMIVDLPPGTGDTQLTMSQKVPMKGSIIVSTPQDIALIDARKGINMFKKVNIPVLGIIENMSYFICDNCNKRHEIFSHGGARNEAQKLGTNFLGEIEIDVNLRKSSDQGKPIGIHDQTSSIAKTYLDIAKKISQK